MITKVDVTNIQGSVLSLPIDSYTNGFVVTSIDGLGPVKATLVSSSFAGLDGSQFQSARLAERNLVVRLQLMPDYVSQSVYDLRAQLYAYFMSKSEVNLKFYFDDIAEIYQITGRVESCEPNMFTKKPTVDISIMCFDPDFVNVTGTTISGNTVSTTTETLINYAGTADTGVVYTLNINRSLSAFSLYLRGPDNVMQTVDIAAALAAGDVVKITTTVGSKAVTLTRSGTTSSLLYAMTPQSAWLTLQQGNNYFRAYAVGAAIPYTLTFNTRRGGM